MPGFVALVELSGFCKLPPPPLTCPNGRGFFILICYAIMIIVDNEAFVYEGQETKKPDPTTLQMKSSSSQLRCRSADLIYGWTGSTYSFFLTFIRRIQ